MRWESNVKHEMLTPAQTWSKRDEGNFGGWSLLTDQNGSLVHFGVPGMKWGVKTKEYVKTGYNTIARRRAILKQKRKAEAKAQFEEGYHRGQRVAANSTLVKRRADKVLERKEGPKESLSDRAVSKAADYALKKTGADKELKKYGLDTYVPLAKNLLKHFKDKKIDDIVESLRTEAGQQKLQKYANFMARGVSKTIGVGQTVARAARQGGRIARKVAGSGIRGAANSAASSIRSGYKWLREGDPRGTEKIHNAVRSVERGAQKKLAELLARKRRRA